jgi:peptidoglycan hydrolase-like protein with peptidoglycan-binding domain
VRAPTSVRSIQRVVGATPNGKLGVVQRIVGVNADGIVGPLTWAAMIAAR